MGYNGEKCTKVMLLGLFSYIPQNLFSVLSGQLRHVHADLLLLVYEQYRKTIYTIDREIIIDLFTEYLETSSEKIIISAETEELLEQHNNRERAFHFLRKFIETEWLIQEQHFDLTFKISLPDYSLRLLETINKIMNGYQMEFRGHVLSIYQNMTSEECHSFVALHQVDSLLKKYTKLVP
ncbi:Wadjet anti-phage system protein JetA family protein [Desulfoscipio gibsoniae]|uniref:Wadjet anti-phage system protein JetA family protein n=1 Tax=Desulfoscipio gibsoniae TaxID=102134 RepID=UPI000232BC77|nr:Wadjet anti-phage system protein JetA family protein [Desulfoscipio gibsoniae]